jgi:uncharacterized protein involved in response to NO
MMNVEIIKRDPFRIFFPLGVLLLLLGILIWVPRIWDAENYPVLLHRTLVLNGFMTAFIGGFLFTAVPRFSRTEFASGREVTVLFLLIVSGLIAGFFGSERLVFLASGMTGLWILFFLIRRIRKRKANPPYSFLFLFVGLILWVISGVSSFFGAPEEMKELHYHGAVMAIILGVGSRLLPGILGHTEIVNHQKKLYEAPVPLYRTLPAGFALLMLAYICSFFLPPDLSTKVCALVVMIIGLSYWKLSQFPKEKTALTISLWICGWLIVLSYILRALWSEGMIHGSHAFFINGLVLLSFLVATRVIQSHGPQDKNLENWKGLYVVTALIFLASATRVSAYLLPERYLSHLGYASLLLLAAILIWSMKFLRFCWY